MTKFTIVDGDTVPRLAAFLDEMDAHHIRAERNENGLNMFKDSRVEAMWEGFVCGWMMRATTGE